MERKRTRAVKVGPLTIGQGAPVRIQSMNNRDTRDVTASLRQIEALAEAGCEITRLAIPDEAAARAFAAIRRQSPLPLVADIHFDHRLALMAIDAGADKVRINPGNIGAAKRVEKIAMAAKAAGIPIRIGVNSGSLPQAIVDECGGVFAETMARAAKTFIDLMHSFSFEDLVISIKASDPMLTIESYRLLAKETDHPLHLGVTEAGSLKEGVIRSAVGIGTLLAEGIGDTLRVSLTADPVEEVKAAYSILKSLGLRRRGVELISCPTCGRTQVDLESIVREVEEKIAGIQQPLKIAIMGCAVNGPGEARHADLGLAGGKEAFLIFRQGKILRKVPQQQAVSALMQEIDRLCQSGSLPKEAARDT